MFVYSLFGNYNKCDGYVDDLVIGNDVNQCDCWGLCGQFLFILIEDFEFCLIVDYDQIDEICCVVGNFVNGLIGGVIGLFGGQIDVQNLFFYDVFNNFDLINEIENLGILL